MANMSWPWAIILCRFNDRPDIPQGADYYADFYTRNGLGGMADYWRVVTLNAFDLTGSQVFGWFTMNHASTELNNLHFPGDRYIPVQWGKDTAVANGVNLNAFRQVLVVQNFGLDHGAAQNGVLIVHHDPAVCEYGFISHEMGHGFGLVHSWSANPDMVYGDGYDVMSWQTTTFNFPISFHGASGLATVGINAHNLGVLNAMPPNRTWLPSHPDFSAALTLDPLNQPPIGNHGFYAAELPPNATTPARASGSAYTVEFRRQAGFDQAIPNDAVIIHEVRTNGNSYLLPSAYGQFTVGSRFVTPDPKILVQVTGIDPTAGSATVWIWDLPEGGLRREFSDPKVYLIQNGTRRWVTSPQVLAALGKTFADVWVVPDNGLDLLPLGADIYIMKISVTPYPVPLNRNVSVTVHAADVTTGANVSGQVFIDQNYVADTNTSFTHIFRRKKILVSTHPREFEYVYPTGTVQASPYAETPIDFGFPDN